MAVSTNCNIIIIIIININIEVHVGSHMVAWQLPGSCTISRPRIGVGVINSARAPPVVVQRRKCKNYDYDPAPITYHSLRFHVNTVNPYSTQEDQHSKAAFVQMNISVLVFP